VYLGFVSGISSLLNTSLLHFIILSHSDVKNTVLNARWKLAEIGQECYTEPMKLITNRDLIVLCAVLGLSLILCLAAWAAAFYLTGDRIDCRLLTSGGFCALRTEEGAGLSIQWAGGLTIWKWGPAGANNRRVWPGE
jgi:hypothetical protein